MSGSWLDADLKTVARQLNAGFRWWCDELAAMLPVWLRPRQRTLATYAFWQGGDRIDVVGRLPRPGVLLVDAALALARSVEVPGLGGADLADMVLLDADRILPVQPSRLVMGVAVARDRPGHATLAALPLAQAQHLSQLLATHAWQPQQVALADPATPGLATVDLTPAMQQAGLIARSGQGLRNWWVVVGCLFALNVGMLVWRDVAAVERLEALVSDQEPAAAATRKIASRIARLQAEAALVARLRGGAGPLDALAAVSQALPDRAWLNRFEARDGAIQVAGFRQADVDVVGAYRKSGRFAAIRSESGGTEAEVLTGQPFALSMTLQEAGQ